MKKLLIATTALTLAAMPAQAQLLGGGGGLTGGLAGGIGSGLDLGSTISRTTDTVNSTTRGAVRGNAATDGSQSVDRRSGRVEARRSADVAGAANVAQLVNTPIAPMSANANGSGNASGSGEAQAQLIGTDAVQSLTGSATGQASATVNSAQSVATQAVAQTHGAVASIPTGLPATSGSANGEGSAEGQGSAGLTSSPLAVAGSAAGAAQGAAAIAPGMPVVSPEGMPIGEVRQIVANSRGEVEEVVVSNGDAMHTIPAADLTANGGALVTGEGSAAANASDSGS
ncbi:hypothetical protein [Altererythrobacter sp.]|uniref:hypothetical protein n=1 Tax=Altererythrobacter sp. TaxID=1872480 RepID=UPI003D14C5BA